MESQGIFSKAISTAETALDLRSIKHNTVVSNIANMDTPNYKAFEFIVEEEFGKLMDAGMNIELKKTHPNHISGKENGLCNQGIEINDRCQLTTRADGNSVNIDKEMASMAENNLIYNSLAQILSNKFEGLKNAIKSGK